jgi:O-antigen/teichoic acid export membrane protein
MIRNAIWNVTAGLSSAILTIALPPILVRLMPVETFGAWVFCLQVAGYMNILGLGLQAVVSKMVAVAVALGNTAGRDAALSTAVLMLLLAGLIGMGGMVLFSICLSGFFPSAEADLILDMQQALLLLGASFALMLPSTAFNGLFIGIERNLYYAIPAILTKIITFAVVILAWFYNQTLAAMGLGWFGATAAGTAILVIFWLKYVPNRQISIRLVSRAAAAELVRDALGLTVWNIAMLLVSGAHLLIVARVAHKDVGIYAIASSLALFIAGLMGAFAGAITPRAANLIAQRQHQALAEIAKSMTLVIIGLGCASTLLLAAWADWLLRLWGGKAFTEAAPAILSILAFAHCVRNLGLVYVMIAVGGGRQRHMLVTPMVEGLVSVSASVVLGARYGSIGVAAGMLIGAVVGIGLLAWQNILHQVSVNLDFFKVLKPTFLVTLIPTALAVCITVGNSLNDAHSFFVMRVWATGCAFFFLLPTLQMLLGADRK